MHKSNDDLTIDEILEQASHMKMIEEPSDEWPEITAEDLRDYQGR